MAKNGRAAFRVFRTAAIFDAARVDRHAALQFSDEIVVVLKSFSTNAFRPVLISCDAIRERRTRDSGTRVDLIAFNVAISGKTGNTFAVVAVFQVDAVGVVDAFVLSGLAFVDWADYRIVKTSDPFVPFDSRAVFNFCINKILVARHLPNKTLAQRDICVKCVVTQMSRLFYAVLYKKNKINLILEQFYL